MSRQKLRYAVRRNGNSVKIFEDGVYVGSYPLPDLAALVKDKGPIRPTGESAQE